MGVGVHRAIAEALLRHAGFDLQDNAPLQPPPALADLLLGTGGTRLPASLLRVLSMDARIRPASPSHGARGTAS